MRTRDPSICWSSCLLAGAAGHPGLRSTTSSCSRRSGPSTPKASRARARCTCASPTSCCRSCSSPWCCSIGVSEVFGWAREIAVPLSWAAMPVGLWCAIDSWLLAPRRQIAARSRGRPGSAVAARGVHGAAGAGGRGHRPHDQRRDARLQPGAAAAVDRDRRGVGASITSCSASSANRRRPQAKPAPLALPEPGTVDYARSFFPVAFIVLLVRAFIFEPFRIPSDSMMPTLLDGDFIVVNKYAYGLRWPVINEKFVDTGSPQRGDVVVFRYPPNPSINYIKRLVGPARRSRRSARRSARHQWRRPSRSRTKGRYTDGCYVDLRLSTETLGEHTHQVMSCRSPDGPAARAQLAIRANPRAAAGLRPQEDRASMTTAAAFATNPPAGHAGFAATMFSSVVPAGHYLMIGDNRDNSDDSRDVGLRARRRIWSAKPRESGSISTCSAPAWSTGAASAMAFE